MQTCAGTFTTSIQSANRASAPLISFDTTTTIMRCRRNGNHVLGNINTNTEAFFINIREVMNEGILIHVSAIQIHMLCTCTLHFIIDGTCNNITRCQIFSCIVALHEGFAIFITQNTTITSHCFSD